MPGDLPARLGKISRDAARLRARRHHRRQACHHGEGALAMGSSQQPTTQQTLQTRDPWGPAQGYLQGTMNQASYNLTNNIGYTPFTGNTTAPLNPFIENAMNDASTLAYAEPAGSGALNNARGFLD